MQKWISLLLSVSLLMGMAAPAVYAEDALPGATPETAAAAEETVQSQEPIIDTSADESTPETSQISTAATSSVNADDSSTPTTTTLYVEMTTLDGKEPKLEKGAIQYYRPTVESEDSSQLLTELGIPFSIEVRRVWWGDRYFEETLPDCENFFDYSMNENGILSVYVKEVPPLYYIDDSGIPQDYHYEFYVVSEDDRFTFSTSGWYMSNDCGQLLMLGDDDLPMTPGAVYYEPIVKKNNGDTVTLNENTTKLKVMMYSTDGWYEGLGQLNPTSYTVKLVGSQLEISTTSNQISTARRLEISAYLEDGSIAKGSIPVGRPRIKFEFPDGNSSGDYILRGDDSLKTFSAMDSDFTLTGTYQGRDGQYTVNLADLDDSKYVLKTREGNNADKPLSESEYFDAQVTDGVVHIHVKKCPPADMYYDIALQYLGDDYVSSGVMFIYEPVFASADTTLTLGSVQQDGKARQTVEHIQDGMTVENLSSNLADENVVILDSNGNQPTSSLVGTGYLICLNGSGAEDAYAAVVGGDVDGDGKVGSTDLYLMCRAMMRAQTLDGVYLKAATPVSNSTSRPASNDLYRTCRYIMKLTNSIYHD